MMEYAIQTQKPLTAKDIRAQVNLIQEVMKAVMKKDTHYGIIPGCDKPSLYKAGAEVLLTTFKISVTPVVEDLSTIDEARYRVTVRGIYRNDGTFVGEGIGECSSNEEKYKWRKSNCDQEWDETSADRRREKWFKGKWDEKSRKNSDPYKAKQVRTEIADVANTVLKMAKKRAEVDMTITATAAGDIFTQDYEDLPEGFGDGEKTGKKTITDPQRKSTGKPQPTDSTPAIEGTALENFAPCPKCKGPLGKDDGEIAAVIEWCNTKRGGDIACRKCQSQK